MRKTVVLLSVFAVMLLGMPGGVGGDVVHLACAGDIATNGNGDTRTSNRILALNPAKACTLGDNVYPSGSASGFNSLYAPTWGRFKAKTLPSPGNHDYKTGGASGYFGYFNVAPYYRAEVGAWDLYSLNSNISRSVSSAQVNWLKQQLAANPTDCIVATWHHPRWSSGDHGNNASVQPFWNALAAANADLILNGHDHDYERFAEKQGIREFVVGTGGVGLRTFHGVVAGSEKRILSLGVLDLALSATGYTYKFIKDSGATLDSGSGSC